MACSLWSLAATAQTGGSGTTSGSAVTAPAITPNKTQPRARDLGVPFDGTPGPSNAVTDAAGVEVGYRMDAMFTALVQATEESVNNTIVAAKTMVGADYWTVPALPHDQLQQVLRKHGLLTP